MPILYVYDKLMMTSRHVWENIAKGQGELGMESKYSMVYNDLLGKIKSGAYPANSKLPSEAALIAQYGVSRDTLRKALNLLDQDGFIQKSKGREAQVLDLEKVVFPVSGLTSFRELAQNEGLQFQTYVKQLEIVKNNRAVMRCLDLKKEDEAWRLYRVREIDGERVILDKDYLNRKYVPELREEDCANSLYAYLEQDLGLKIGFAQKEITVRKITEEDKLYLDLSKSDLIVVVSSYVYLENAALFQYTESRHRWDKFRFVDFAKRSHKP